MNKRFAFILFTLAALLAFSRCAVRSDAADNYTFSWDISAENHTGLSFLSSIRDQILLKYLGPAVKKAIGRDMTPYISEL